MNENNKANIIVKSIPNLEIMDSGDEMKIFIKKARHSDSYMMNNLEIQ